MREHLCSGSVQPMADSASSTSGYANGHSSERMMLAETSQCNTSLIHDEQDEDRASFKLKLPSQRLSPDSRKVSSLSMIAPQGGLLASEPSTQHMPVWKRLVLKAVFIAFVLLYLILGSFLFASVEQEQHSAEIMELLHRIRQRVPPADKTNTTMLIKAELQRLLNSIEPGSMPYSTHLHSWQDFGSSFLFSFTVVSTIGYGHIYPVTWLGRLLCVGYALLGIPVFMIVVADLGKAIWMAIRCLLRAHWPNCTGESVGELPLSLSAPLFVLIFVLYLLLGTLFLPQWEAVGYSDAFYFLFITVTTIGFGDFTPDNVDWLPLTLMYVFVGLALTTLAIEVLAAAFRRFHYIGYPIEGAAKAGVWIGGKLLTVEHLIRSMAREVGMTEEEMTEFHKKLDEVLEQTVQEIATTGRIILPRCRRLSSDASATSSRSRNTIPIIFAPKHSICSTRRRFSGVYDNVPDSWKTLMNSMSFVDHDPESWIDANNQPHSQASSGVAL